MNTIAAASNHTFGSMHTVSAHNFLCLQCMLPQHRLPVQKDMKVFVFHSLLASQLLPWGQRAKRSCSRYLWKSTCSKNQIHISQSFKI